MRPDHAVLPPRFLRTKEAAEFLGLSARTLEKHRTYGTGPAYRKLGGRVVYAIDDLEAWADRGAGECRLAGRTEPRGSEVEVTAPPAHSGRYAR
ncbi:helix-turn-helix transcriptional regulator [Bradyrhizobium sp.]|uniref:helix-turn-helix transcriptional regulator n=1 Tax=Bradyrhizobium sp. TaxID=376 RepID=UPI00391B1850